MRLRSDASGGGVEIDLEPPEDQQGEGFRPTVLMGRLWAAIDGDPGITLNRLRDAVKGNNAAKTTGLQLLIDEEYVRVERDGQARRHHVAKPFLEEAPEPNRAHRAQPRPDRARARSKPTAPTAPPPLGGAGHGWSPTVTANRAHAQNGAGYAEATEEQEALHARLTAEQPNTEETS